MRHTRDLLHFDYVFVQRRLLPPDRFVRACSDRGLNLFAETLEAFHEAGMLAPLFRVSRDARAELAELRREDPSRRPFELPFFGSGPIVDWLRFYDTEGNLHDPSEEAFQPWSKWRCQIEGYTVQESEFLYSPYQLLLVPILARAQRHMRRRRDRDIVRYEVPSGEHLAQLREEAAQYADLIVTLSALEPYYHFRLFETGTIPPRGDSLEQARRDFVRALRDFKAAPLAQYLGWSAERLRREAEFLITRADSIDPLRRWLPLVRQIAPALWDDLRGDARVAMDHRIAGETLLLFYEDLVREGEVPPLPEIPPLAPHALNDRLTGHGESLERVLTHFGLSPQPAVVLVIEGHTEAYVVPRVRELLEAAFGRASISIVTARGIDKNLDLLASYVATPLLGRQLRDAALLERPPTHFFVAFDAEKRYSSPEKREQRRRLWVDLLRKAVQETQGLDVDPDDLALLVTVESWSETDEQFEFAHFSDEEIAGGALAIHRGPDRPSLVEVCEQVRRLRARPDKQGNLDSVWYDWPPPRPTKTRLAEHLWPSLRTRIEDALRRNAVDEVPVARVVRRAIRIAHETSRRSVVIRLVPKAESGA